MPSKIICFSITILSTSLIFAATPPLSTHPASSSSSSGTYNPFQSPLLFQESIIYHCSPPPGLGVPQKATMPRPTPATALVRRDGLILDAIAQQKREINAMCTLLVELQKGHEETKKKLAELAAQQTAIEKAQGERWRQQKSFESTVFSELASMNHRINTNHSLLIQIQRLISRKTIAKPSEHGDITIQPRPRSLMRGRARLVSYSSRGRFKARTFSKKLHVSS